MPSTFNTIGTAYCDDRNVAAAFGTCRHCHWSGDLISKDVTLAFVVGFIPIVKLKNYRIAEYCGRCRRHFAMPLDDFRKRFEAALEPDKALARAGDREARRRVVLGYLASGYRTEAAEWLALLLEETPEDAGVWMLEGQIREKTRPTEAWNAYERAAALAPDDVLVLKALARAQVRAAQYVGAAETYARLHALEPAVPEHLLERARSLRIARQYDQALDQFEKFFELFPEKKKVGVFVDEMTATRKFRSAPMLPWEAERAASRRRTNRVALAFILGVPVLGLVGVGVLMQRVNVVIDNASSIAMKLRLDGQPWLEVAPHQFTVVGVWRGKHQVEMEAGAEKDAFPVDWNPGFLAGGTCVLDPLLEGQYVVYEVGYGTSAVAPPKHHLGERTFVTSGYVDDVFTPPPGALSVKRGESVVRRVLARVDGIRPIAVVRALVEKKQTAEAIRYAERHLATSDEPELLYGLLYAHRANGDAGAFEKWLTDHLSWEPRSVSLHRFRQDRAWALGAESVLDEYRTAPNDAVGTYLRGRAAPTGRQALEHYRVALEQDPALPWAWLDAGEELLDQGEEVEAIRHFERFSDLRRGKGVRAFEDLWRALFVTRRWEQLTAYLDLSRTHDPFSDMVRAHLAIVTDTGKADWARLHAEVAQRHGKYAWVTELLVDRARWAGDVREADGQIKALASLQGDRTDPDLLRAGVLLGARDLAGAGAALRSVFAKPEPPRRAVLLAILMSIVAEWTGQDGEEWRSIAEQSATIRADHDVCRFLAGRLTAGELAARDRHRSTDGRAVSRLARALRAPSMDERHALVDEALRYGAWDMSDAAFLVRHVFAKVPRAR